jgi:hypothetical protein
MRAKFLVVAGVALFLSSCGGGGNPAPPPIDKKLLAGKWKSTSDFPFIVGYEFAEDGTMKTTVRGMDKPAPGRYSWGGERTLNLEYDAKDDVRQAYQAAVKAYQKEVEDRIKGGKLDSRAGPSILGAVPDALPTNETFRVGMSEKPRLLILNNDSGVSQTLEKAD